MTKIVLITGSTDGIGKLAAINLAKAGHQVYLHGRNKDKLAQVINDLKQEAAVDVDGFVADLSDLTAVQQLAQDITAKLPKLDVLINNAGIFKTKSTITNDGLDVRYVVNYLAPYILTNGLLPILKKSNEARIINLSSAAQSRVTLEGLTGQTTLSANEAYAQSKLALTMWSMYLATQLRQDNINVIAVNPGSLLNTRMANEAYGQHWSSADKGANILTDLAISTEFANDTRKFFDNDIKGKYGSERGEFGQPHGDALDQRAISQLIEQTEGLLHKIF